MLTVAKPQVNYFPIVLQEVRNVRAAMRRWTLSEQHLLEKMLADRKTAAQIGLKLDRREQAVYARVQRLRLKGKLPQHGLSFSRRSVALIRAQTSQRSISP